MIILGIIGLLLLFYIFKDILAFLFWIILIAIIIALLTKLVKHIKSLNKPHIKDKEFFVDNVSEWYCPECDYKNKSGHVCKSCGYEAKVKSIETNKSIQSYSGAPTYTSYPKEQWICTKCYHLNERATPKCLCCGAVRSENDSINFSKSINNENTRTLELLAKPESPIKNGSVFACDCPVCNAIKDNLNNRFIAFDVETTGLSPKNDRIVEIGAVLFENGIPVKRFETLVNPQVEISPQATKVNHITNDMLLAAPSEETVYSDLIEFLGDAFSDEINNSQTFLCAHNAKFDMDFLSQTLERLGYRGNIVYVDTLPTARSLVYGVENYKQPTLAKYFDIVNRQEHRAASDAEVCGNILIKLLALLKNEKKISIDTVKTSSTLYKNKEYKKSNFDDTSYYLTIGLPDRDSYALTDEDETIHFTLSSRSKKYQDNLLDIEVGQELTIGNEYDTDKIYFLLDGYAIGYAPPKYEELIYGLHFYYSEVEKVTETESGNISVKVLFRYK